MFENFSAQSKRILEKLEMLKNTLMIEIIGTETLLLALIEVDDSILKYILEEYKVDISLLKKDLSECLIIRKLESEYTHKFKEVIKNSYKLAESENSKLIYDEHIIYTLLSTPDCLGYFILNKYIQNIDALANDFANIFDIGIEEDTFLFNLTKEAKYNRLNRFIGRTEEVNRVIRILNKKQKNNPLLIGNAGVGKSAIVEEVAKVLYKRSPEYTLYRLDLGTIIAGTKYRGDLEERLLKILERVKNPYAIIFIDEIHNVMSTGSSEGTLDIANILKPILSRNEIKCIGATTLDEYYGILAKDKALARRFQNVFIDEPSIEEVVTILKGIKKDYQKHYRVKYSDQIISYIVDKSSLIANRFFPDKAIDVFDEVGLYCKSIHEKNVTFSMVDKITFDFIGLNYSRVIENLRNIKYYPELRKYYQIYLMNLFNLPVALRVATLDEEITKLLLLDLQTIFNLKSEAIIRLDMNKYFDQHSLNNLLGSPKGYVGYESGGILTEHVLKYPFNVIILKNYNSSSYASKDLIEEILSTGYVLDAKGRNISFKNSIFIFEGESKELRVGFIHDDNNQSHSLFQAVLDSKKDNEEYLEKLIAVIERLKRYHYDIRNDIKTLTYEEYLKAIKALENFNQLEVERKYKIIKTLDQISILPI